MERSLVLRLNGSLRESLLCLSEVATVIIQNYFVHAHSLEGCRLPWYISNCLTRIVSALRAVVSVHINEQIYEVPLCRVTSLLHQIQYYLLSY